MTGLVPRLKVFLFGAPRIELDSQPVTLHRSKALALLSYLCMDPRPHSRDSIIDTLWPLFGPEDARNNLRRELSLLKKSLTVEILHADRAIIGIDPTVFSRGDLEVDTTRFEYLVNKATSHGETADLLCPDCLQWMQEAITLYTGDFLAGFSLPDSPPFDEWQFFQAERLRRLALFSLDQLIEWHRQYGEIDQAIQLSRRRIAMDNLHEPAHRTLMALYAHSGQQAAALRQFDKLKQLLRDELSLEPEIATRELFEAIYSRKYEVQKPASGEPVSSSVSSAKTYTKPHQDLKLVSNLPADMTPFIGRQSEIDHLQNLLTDSMVRLITIIGIGGMGKTRLALAAGRRIYESGIGTSLFRDGIYFVSLVAVEEFRGMASAISLSLGLTPVTEKEQSQQLIDYLRARQALLILDNFEHLVASEVREFLQELLANSPAVKVLTTSRVKLGLRGEHVFPLSGLAVPDPSMLLDAGQRDYVTSSISSNGSNYSAITLFITAGRRVKPDFSLTPDNVATIVNICRLVQGMPLGIELAAGWLGLLQPEAIEAEIEHCLEFLESDISDFPDRQSSLKAVFDSSWKLLSVTEQQSLAQLTIFRGGFTRQAAEKVADTGIRTLLSLTNKSWLQQIADDRYQIHELLRQFASQELEAFSEINRDLNERYAHYYASFMGGLGTQIKGPQPSLAFKAITRDLDNILASFEWLIKADQFSIITEQLLVPLFHYLESRYLYYLFQPLIRAARLRAEELKLTTERAIILVFRVAFFITGFPTRFLDYPWINTADMDIVRITQKLMPEDPEKAGFWGILQAWHYGRLLDVQAGVTMLRKLLAWYISHNLPWEVAFTRQSLGRLLLLQDEGFSKTGDARESQTCLRQSLHEFEVLGDLRESAISLFFIGLEQQRFGEFAEAKKTILEAQERLRNVGEDIIAANSYWQLADIHMSMGEPDVSLQYLRDMGEFLVQRGRLQLATMAISRLSYEAVRYGDLDEALRIREYSLESSQRFQDDFLIAWDYWEMGEIYRVKGELRAARQWFDRSIAHFEKEGASIGNTFYLRGMGDLALAEGNYMQAEQLFSQSIEWAQRTVHPWQEAYGSFGLAKAYLGQGNLAKSRHHFTHGLRLALANEDAGGLALMGIAGVAKLYHHTGDTQRAAKLVELILSHPLTWEETRRQAASLIGLENDDLPAKQPKSMVAIAPIIHEVLAELELQNRQLSD
jgi:predicted ATPase/DNA-binding SARP family transcriptional activator